MQGLDKTQIGDYLGEREDYSLKVMHAYVDALDFSGSDFDDAIREFLSGGCHLWLHVWSAWCAVLL